MSDSLPLPASGPSPRRAFLRKAGHAAGIAATTVLATSARSAEPAPSLGMRAGAINIVAAGGLQAAFDALPPHGGTIFIPAGTHRIDRPVSKQLLEGQHLFLVGEGRGSVLLNTATTSEPLLRITGVPGSWWPDLRMTFRDLAFLGNPRSGDGLSLLFPNDASVDSCFFLGHGGHAITLGPQGTNVTVRDCWMRDCKRGIRADGIHHLTLH